MRFVDELVKVIKDVGFPIFVGMYLLVRFDRLMVTLVAAQGKELEILYQLRDHLMYGRKVEQREN